MKPTTLEEMDRVLSAVLISYPASRQGRPLALRDAAVEMFLRPDKFDSLDVNYVRDHLTWLNRTGYLRLA